MDRPIDFFARNPVFTRAEFDATRSGGTANPRTVEALLAYHVRRGRVVRIRRGLFGSVPIGESAVGYVPDPYLIAAKLAPDAVLAYHTALEFHGVAQSPFRRLTILSEFAARPVQFGAFEFVAVRPPQSIARSGAVGFGVETASRAAMTVRVTSIERTIVDVFDRPDLCGGLDEILRSLGTLRGVYAPRVAEYVTALGNRTVAAKVGWFLDSNREALGIDAESIDRIGVLSPRQPVYLDASDRGPRRLVGRWNLICPESVLGSKGDVLP